MTPPPFNPQVPQYNPYATVVVRYSGNWALIDWNMSIEVNGAPAGRFSFKKPAEFVFQVQPPMVYLRAKLSWRKAEISLPVEPGQTYLLYLDYDPMWGSISFRRSKF